MAPPTQDPLSSSERFLAWLEKALSDRKNPDGAFQKLFRSFRKGLTVATVAYFFLLLVLLFLLGWWGERNWFLSILLFLPAIIWVAPLILLAPLHFIVRPKLCWITLVALLVTGFVYLDFCWSFADEKRKPGLTVLTNNMGNRKFQSIIGFLEKENPDLIALQDSWRAGSSLGKQYPERFISSLGEYTLLSKIPIRKSGLLTQLAFRGRPIGAWHELEYQGQSIVIYNIHMPTPRQEFLKLRGRGFIVELIGGKGIYSSEVRNAYKEFIKMKMKLARDLTSVLQEEQRPFLIAGDFNMPANGYAWDLFNSRLADAFGAKGRGYGFTFPGSDETLLDLFGPWLRLDYLFAGKNWQPLWCRVEPRAPAEHRAVIAKFGFEPTAHKP